jgi:HAD superfamily hydrolase (TIGR01509 family)
MNFTTAIFDMDGTLFDTERVALECWHEAFKRRSVHVPHNDLETVIGLDWKGTRDFLGNFVPPDASFEDFLESARDIRKRYIGQHGLPVKSGANELLSLLRDRGIKLGLATTTHSERTEENLKAARIEEYFQIIVCGDQVERYKPHPDIYLKALAGLKSAAHDSIALEDSDHGIQSAYAAGLRVIHIPDIKRIDEKTRACVHREYGSLLEFRDEISRKPKNILQGYKG